MYGKWLGWVCALGLSAGVCQASVPQWYAESSAVVARQACQVAACEPAPVALRHSEASGAGGDNISQLALADEVMSRSENMRDAKRWFALDLLLLGAGVLCLIAYCRRLLGPDEDEMC